MTERTYYSIPLTADSADQVLTVNFDGLSLRLRVYYATGPGLWWLGIESADGAVTLSHRILRAGVMTAFQGRYPGYSGTLDVGMIRVRKAGVYSSISAFGGDFELQFSI